MDELNALLAELPGADLVTDAMKIAALQGARIPDAAGRWPGAEDYVDTFDPYFAALGLLGFLRAQPFVRSASSEGTGITVDAPDWNALAAFYRGLSPIARLAGSGPLRKVAIPDLPHVRRVDMSGRWDGYGDVDTDLG